MFLKKCLLTLGVIIGFTVLAVFGGSAIWVYWHGNAIIADDIEVQIQVFIEKYSPSVEAQFAMQDIVLLVRTHRFWNGMLLRDYIQIILKDKRVDPKELSYLLLFLDRVFGKDLGNREVAQLLKMLELELGLPLIQTAETSEE